MSKTPRTDEWLMGHADDTPAQWMSELLTHTRQLERENAALRNLLHEIREDTWVSIKTCRRIDAAIEAAEKTK